MMDSEHTVGVVACDLNMPGMDGYEFLQNIGDKPEFESIPIVMITSMSDEVERVKAFELGANDFIVKPFNEAILRARLKNMLHMKQLQDELRKQKEMRERMAITNALTNIPKVRRFMGNLNAEYIRISRLGGTCSVLLLDLDHFKRINDAFGHPRGDSFLRESVQIIIESVKEVDPVVRYGCEEYVVTLPQTALEEAVRIA